SFLEDGPCDPGEARRGRPGTGQELVDIAVIAVSVLVGGPLESLCPAVLEAGIAGQQPGVVPRLPHDGQGAAGHLAEVPSAGIALGWRHGAVEVTEVGAVEVRTRLTRAGSAGVIDAHELEDLVRGELPVVVEIGPADRRILVHEAIGHPRAGELAGVLAEARKI